MKVEANLHNFYIFALELKRLFENKTSIFQTAFAL